MNSNRIKGNTALMLFIGITLLLPPIVMVFNKPVVILGIPLTVLYLFLVWIGLILGCLWSSNRLPE